MHFSGSPTFSNMSIASHFSRFMNQYFLLIACLQLWSLITPVNPASTWGPLIFIFAVSASKEAWDDYNRYLSDKKANEKEVWVVRQGTKKHVRKFQYSFSFGYLKFVENLCNLNFFVMSQHNCISSVFFFFPFKLNDIWV